MCTKRTRVRHTPLAIAADQQTRVRVRVRVCVRFAILRDETSVVTLGAAAAGASAGWVRPLVGMGVPAVGRGTCLDLEVKPDLVNTPAAARPCVSFDFFCCALAAAISS